VIAEKVKVEKILISTTIARGLLWGVLLPLIWFLLDSRYVWNDIDRGSTLACLIILSGLDGAAVAFANVVDIDSGGVDLLAAQHGLEVDDAFRNRMNSIHQMVFDSSFLVFTPLMALLGWYIGDIAKDSTDSHDVVAGGVVCVFAVMFFIASIVSWYHYRFGMEETTHAEYQMLNESNNEQNNEQPHDSIWASMVVGAKLCWKTKPVRWRLFFLGLEIALEDGMVAVVAVEYAYSSRFFADGNKGLTLVYTAVIVAIGKIGALIAGKLMHSFWEPPVTKDGFRPLFLSVLCGSSAVSLLYVAHSFEKNNAPESALAWVSRCLVLLGAILFFLFSTAPKIGFATLLQGMASSVEGSGKIFGFVGPFISIIDSFVVMGLSLLFHFFKGQCHELECEHSQFSKALLATCGIYLTHGIAECFLGPWLMLPADGSLNMLRNIGVS